jgi:hypothetical protein
MGPIRAPLSLMGPILRLGPHGPMVNVTAERSASLRCRGA